MTLERPRVYSRRVTRTISIKTPQVEQTIAKWKLADKQKSCKQRCTRYETGGFFMTNVGIISIAVLFCYCVPPNIFRTRDDINHTQKLSENPSGVIVFALALTSSTASLLCLWLTYITDPGVIPRQREIEARRLKEGERHCPECKIIRPPKGKHCKHCNHCVEVFDHHCPYAGVCVGNGNYLFFCLLLLSGIISSTYVSIFSVWFLKDNWPAGHQNWKGLKFQLIIALILTVVCGLIFLLIGHLSLYHVFIVVKGQTTNERIKSKRSEKSHKSNNTLDTPLKVPLLGSGLSRLSQETTSCSDAAYSVTETKESYTLNDYETSTGYSRFTDL